MQVKVKIFLIIFFIPTYSIIYAQLKCNYVANNYMSQHATDRFRTVSGSDQKSTWKKFFFRIYTLCYARNKIGFLDNLY